MRRVCKVEKVLISVSGIALEKALDLSLEYHHQLPVDTVTLSLRKRLKDTPTIHTMICICVASYTLLTSNSYGNFESISLILLSTIRTTR